MTRTSIFTQVILQIQILNSLFSRLVSEVDNFSVIYMSLNLINMNIYYLVIEIKLNGR